MTNKPIRALIFDYGGVLMRTADPTSRRSLEREFDLEPREAAEHVFGSPLWDEVQLGHIDYDTFWDDVRQRIGLREAELERFRRQFWGGDRLDEELVALIRRLADEGYRTALLSNAPANLRPYIKELGIADAFDVIVISGEEGLIKPTPEIYERVLSRLDIAPDEAVFVDDMRENVVAARRLGLHAIRFQGPAPLRKQLRKLGVPAPEPEYAPVPDLRAVIFDWGGVVEERPEQEEILALERQLGLEPGMLREILGGEPWRKLAIGAITGEDYLTRIAPQLGLPDGETALAMLKELYTSMSLRSQVIDAVRTLRDRYRIALLSNAFVNQREVILDYHDFDVKEEFDVYVNSAEAGIAKPDPEIYHLTLERLRVAPEQAVFLDDSLRNIDAARELGVHSLQFVDLETSLDALEQLLGHPI